MRAIGFAILIGMQLGLRVASCGEPIDFDTQVIPALTRQGCNAGSCHGAALGRGGFKLSLLGSNAVADHDALVHQREGRRVNLVEPGKSLVLRKPSEQIGHEGGLALPDDSPAFELIHRWIKEGALRHDDRVLTKLTISPLHQTLVQPGDSTPVRVTATFVTGQSADVTAWTVFQASDPEAIAIDDDGRRFTALRRGVHVVIARFLDRVVPIRITVPMHDTEPQVTATSTSPRNRIDQFVDRQLRELNLPASEPADDWRFLRRVVLDLSGRLPTAEETRTFTQDASPTKRERLIRQLLDSDAFADYWALKWANELGIDSKKLQPEGAAAYQQWLAERLRRDAPMDETARAMLTSIGDSYQDGAVNFLRSSPDAGTLAEDVSRVFLGVRLQCANCHDHPLDHWKQDDYHGLAAIFAKIRRGRVVTVSDRGEVTHPVTGRAAIPRIPGDRYLKESTDGRLAFAQWLTRAENPYFAKAIVNRLWRQLMGRGLVDPVDDLRATNPPSHPDLLRWLATDFVDHGFRIKHTIEVICNSSAYARDSTTLPGNAMDLAFYSHALAKPLEAEVVADAIRDVTGIPLRSESADLPRAVKLTDNRAELAELDILGRCDREASCNGSGDSSVSLARSLHMIHGNLINSRVQTKEGRLHTLLDANPDDAEVLDEIFLWTLTRPAVSTTPYWREQLSSIDGADPKRRTEFFEDVLWGLLTSQSFATNR